jgi:hypothetical protein
MRKSAKSEAPATFVRLREGILTPPNKQEPTLGEIALRQHESTKLFGAKLGNAYRMERNLVKAKP